EFAGGALGGDAHHHDLASFDHAVAGDAEGGGRTERFEGHVHAPAPGDLADRFGGVDLGGVHGVGGAQFAGRGELVVADVHGDDRRGAEHGGQLHQGGAHSTGGHHRDRVPDLDVRGVPQGPVGGHRGAADRGHVG